MVLCLINNKYMLIEELISKKSQSIDKKIEIYQEEERGGHLITIENHQAESKQDEDITFAEINQKDIHVNIVRAKPLNKREGQDLGTTIILNDEDKGKPERSQSKEHNLCDVSSISRNSQEKSSEFFANEKLLFI